MTTTLVGIFDTYASAEAAVRELGGIGVKHTDITIARNDHPNGYTVYGGPRSTDYTTGSSIGTRVAEHFAGVLGSDADEGERGWYAESVRRGGTVVTANVSEGMLARATDVLNTHGAVDVDRRASQYRAGGYQEYDIQAPLYSPHQAAEELKTYDGTNEVALPVIEESLHVGKRTVQRGGVRIVSRTSERAVEETVSLRTEQVHVERHAVDREVSSSDLSSLRAESFDVTTTSEEAVVSKEARVVEEVVVGKDVTEREETVRDTVRRTDVEVEQIEGATAKPAKKGKR